MSPSSKDATRNRPYDDLDARCGRHRRGARSTRVVALEPSAAALPKTLRWRRQTIEERREVTN